MFFLHSAPFNFYMKWTIIIQYRGQMCWGWACCVDFCTELFHEDIKHLPQREKKASNGCCNSLNGRAATLLKISENYSLFLFYPHVLRQVDFIKEVSKQGHTGSNKASVQILLCTCISGIIYYFTGTKRGHQFFVYSFMSEITLQEIVSVPVVMIDFVIGKLFH